MSEYSMPYRQSEQLVMCGGVCTSDSTPHGVNVPGRRVARARSRGFFSSPNELTFDSCVLCGAMSL